MSPEHSQRAVVCSRIRSAVDTFGLNLAGSGVLTEAASGPYVATSLLAALAGSDHVVACVRDSRWATAGDVKRETLALAKELGVAGRIEVTTRPPVEVADGLNVVTNLGFVRPITAGIVERLAPHAAVALMWEPWELRDADIDFAACRNRAVPVIATNERHPHVATFSAVGLLGLKLLLEAGCEVAGLSVVVVGSDPFGECCKGMLEAVGAKVVQLLPSQSWMDARAEEYLCEADAVVLAEHRFHGEILGRTTAKVVDVLAARGTPVAHICGSVDGNYLTDRGVLKRPGGEAPPGYMLVTTAHVGLKPVVDLHAAGLLVAGIVSRERKLGKSVEESVDAAVRSGYGLRLPERVEP